MPLGTITAKQNGNICTSNWKYFMEVFFYSMFQDGKLFRQNSFLVTSTNRDFYCQHSCCNWIAAMILLSYKTNCSTKTRLVIVITRPDFCPPLNIRITWKAEQCLPHKASCQFAFYSQGCYLETIPTLDQKQIWQGHNVTYLPHFASFNVFNLKNSFSLWRSLWNVVRTGTTTYIQTSYMNSWTIISPKEINLLKILLSWNLLCGHIANTLACTVVCFADK